MRFAIGFYVLRVVQWHRWDLKPFWTNDSKTTPECLFVKASKQGFECGKLNARDASENQIWRNIKKKAQCIPGQKIMPASCLRQEMEEKNNKDDQKTEVCFCQQFTEAKQDPNPSVFRQKKGWVFRKGLFHENCGFTFQGQRRKCKAKDWCWHEWHWAESAKVARKLMDCQESLSKPNRAPRSEPRWKTWWKRRHCDENSCCKGLNCRNPKLFWLFPLHIHETVAFSSSVMSLWLLRCAGTGDALGVRGLTFIQIRPGSNSVVWVSNTGSAGVKGGSTKDSATGALTVAMLLDSRFLRVLLKN